jgi:hypothetical protein
MTKKGDPTHFVAFAAAVLLACTAALCIAGDPGSPVPTMSSAHAWTHAATPCAETKEQKP